MCSIFHEKQTSQILREVKQNSVCDQFQETTDQI